MTSDFIENEYTHTKILPHFLRRFFNAHFMYKVHKQIFFNKAKLIYLLLTVIQKSIGAQHILRYFVKKITIYLISTSFIFLHAISDD